MAQAFAGFLKGFEAVINAQPTAFENAPSRSPLAKAPLRWMGGLFYGGPRGAHEGPRRVAGARLGQSPRRGTRPSLGAPWAMTWSARPSQAPAPRPDGEWSPATAASGTQATISHHADYRPIVQFLPGRGSGSSAPVPSWEIACVTDGARVGCADLRGIAYFNE